MSLTLSDILTTLTFRERNYILSLLNYIELVRLSACNHSLRGIVCNNNVLWRELYKCRFLSGAYRIKEWEFVFWCFRTDPNTISIPARRSDVVNNVDWYNTYRRRIATENNWRHGYSNTTEMDLKWSCKGGKKDVLTYASATSTILLYKYFDTEGRRELWYNIEYPAHLDLKHANNKTREYSLSTLLKTPPLYGDDASNSLFSDVFVGDHYAIGTKETFQQSGTTRTLALLSHGSEDKNAYVIVDSLPGTEVKMVDGKWALLCEDLYKNYSHYCANITVLDMESATKHSGFIDDIWDATCFYETNDESAIVYTVIFKKDDKGRIEWALHQFSGTSQVNRIRSGWFYVAAIFFTGPKKVYAIDQSQVVLEFSNDKGRVFQIIVHSVASSGQSDEPHNTPWLKYGGLPIPLLKAGLKCDYSKPMIFYSKPFSDDQSMQFSDFSHYRHVIGSLYCIVEGGYKQEKVYLVDIDKKEIVRKIESTKSYGAYGAYSFIGVRYVGRSNKQGALIIKEYGAL